MPTGPALGAADFERLYALHATAIRTYLSLWCRQAADLDDMTQEVWQRAWEKRAQFRPGTSFRKWLMAISRHLVISTWRKANAKKRAPAAGVPYVPWDQHEAWLPAEQVTSVEELVLRREALRARWEAMAMLRAARIARRRRARREVERRQRARPGALEARRAAERARYHADGGAGRRRKARWRAKQRQEEVA